MGEQLKAMREQIEALATQLSNMGDHNGNGSGNPFAVHRTNGYKHHSQVQANRWVNEFKLNIPEFQDCLQPEEFLVTEKIEKINKKKVPREATEIRSQLVVEEEDGFIEEDCLVD
jgi:hypothetical protein